MQSQTTRLVYSRDFLLSFRQCSSVSSDTKRALSDPSLRELRPRKRGRRGGIREKTRRRIFKLAMPSIILGNAQSLRNKTDELEACVRYLREYREANLVCLSETWLSGMDLDPDLPGFSVMRSDRSRTATGKKQGGGVCVYVNEKWCTNVTAREEFCSKDIELLSVALRPFYLPREFQRVFVTVVYIPPKADVKAAADKIREVVMKQESTCPDSIRLVLGDFNACRLSKVLPNYRQYVTCKTCKDSTLDRFTATWPGRIRASPSPL